MSGGVGSPSSVRSYTQQIGGNAVGGPAGGSGIVGNAGGSGSAGGRDMIGSVGASTPYLDDHDSMEEDGSYQSAESPGSSAQVPSR